MTIINLNKRYSIILTPTSPFNFDATVYKPSHFPSSDCCWEKGRYWIMMLWDWKYLGLKFENRGTIIEPKIRLSIYSQSPLSKEYVENLVPVKN